MAASARWQLIVQSEMFAAIDNGVTLPSFTRLDGALVLNVSQRLSALVNVENQFDRRYFPTSHSNNNIMPGSSRMFRVGLGIVQ